MVPHSIQLSTMFPTKKEILNKLFDFWKGGGGLNRLPQLSQSRDPMREICPLFPPPCSPPRKALRLAPNSLGASSEMFVVATCRALLGQQQ